MMTDAVQSQREAVGVAVNRGDPVIKYRGQIITVCDYQGGWDYYFNRDLYAGLDDALDAIDKQIEGGDPEIADDEKYQAQPVGAGPTVRAVSPRDVRSVLP
jgi:hypothetical protein